MRVLGERHRVVGLDRGALDLAEPDAVRREVGGRDFDALLCPAAITGVDYCEAHPEEAMRVNAEAPALLAELAAAKGARFVHYSTDYVFGGDQPGERGEADPVGPLGAYGRSKAAGEQRVLAVSPRFWVARVSWVFGPERASFLEAIVGRALAGEALSAVADKYSVPSAADDLCRMTEALLRLPEGEGGGLVHLCNGGGGCSWQEYGQAAVDAAARAGLPLRSRAVAPMRLEEIGFEAPRPRHTAMSNARFTRLTGCEPRPWREAVEEHVARYGSRWGP